MNEIFPSECALGARTEIGPPPPGRCTRVARIGRNPVGLGQRGQWGSSLPCDGDARKAKERAVSRPCARVTPVGVGFAAAGAVPLLGGWLGGSGCGRGVLTGEFGHDGGMSS